MIFTALQKDSLESTPLDTLELYSMVLTPPVESFWTETAEVFPFLSKEQVKELDTAGGAMVLCKTKEEIESYYKQIPVLKESMPICIYFDKFDNIVKQK